MHNAAVLKKHQLMHILSLKLLFHKPIQDPDLVPVEEDCDDPEIVKGEVSR